MTKEFDRRDFLAQATVAGAMGMTGVALADDSNLALAGAERPQEGEHEVFQKLVGSKFQAVDVEAARFSTLKLTEVRVYKRPANDGRPTYVRQHSFSLLFAVPGEEDLKNKIHQLTHPALGSCELFLHRAQCGNRPGVYYEAVVG